MYILCSYCSMKLWINLHIIQIKLWWIIFFIFTKLLSNIQKTFSVGMFLFSSPINFKCCMKRHVSKQTYLQYWAEEMLNYTSHFATSHFWKNAQLNFLLPKYIWDDTTVTANSGVKVTAVYKECVNCNWTLILSPRLLLCATM